MVKLSNENLKETIPSAECDGSRTTAECGMFNLAGDMITSDASYTQDIKSTFTMVELAFNKKTILFARKLNLNLRQKLIKCCIWSTNFYGAEIWTLRKVDQKYLGSF
jgi:hypothetical protein